MERARKMLSMALAKQSQLFHQTLEPSTSYENNPSSSNVENEVPDISVNEGFQNVKEHGGNANETQNAVSHMDVEEEKDFDADDSIFDPDFVPSDSDNVSNKSDISLSTKNAGSQVEQNLLFGDCESIHSENDEENSETNAKQPKKLRKEKDTSKRYLSSDLSIAELFRLYSEKYNPVSLSKFSKIFNTLNLKFKKTKLDTCHKCEVLKMKIDVATDEEERENLKKEQNDHHLEADLAYKSKATDKSKAENFSSIKVLTFDLQQCLPTPFLRTSVSFYKRPLWTYNLTVHDCKTGQPVCYMWHEALANRGGNEIASCVFNHLQNLPAETRHVVLYSDCCPGQNKNSFIASMFETFLQMENNVETIDHKFLLPGHTHMECDVDHALIEKKKKLTTVKIHHPRDWYQFVRTVGVKHKFDVKEVTQDQIFNFSAVSKEKFMWRKVDNDGQKFCWQKVKWMRFTKEFGMVYFKTSLKENEDFRTLNIRRRGFNSIKITDLQKCYSSPLEINEKKKQDLLDMLPLIDNIYHPFYQNLNTNTVADFHPDLTEGDEEDR